MEIWPVTCSCPSLEIHQFTGQCRELIWKYDMKHFFHKCNNINNYFHWPVHRNSPFHRPVMLHLWSSSFFPLSHPSHLLTNIYWLYWLIWLYHLYHTICITCITLHYICCRSCRSYHDEMPWTYNCIFFDFFVQYIIKLVNRKKKCRS